MWGLHLGCIAHKASTLTITPQMQFMTMMNAVITRLFGSGELKKKV